MSIVTPFMMQYQAIKEQYPDCLLFFRLGDFYELFGDDAKIASSELSLVLTGRNAGSDQRVPMCGVPYHAANNYIARLMEKGYKVAICEQLEDPKLAKGLVKRDVIRVVTPGTVLEDNMLDSKRHNYLAACWRQRKRNTEIGFGIAFCDISTGQFQATQFEGTDLRERLADELARIDASELILPSDLYDDEFFQLRIKGYSAGTLSHNYDDVYIKGHAQQILQEHFHVSSLSGLGLDDKPCAAAAAAMILDFLERTQKRSLEYIDKLQVYSSSEFMVLDAATRRNLELTATIRSNKRKGSLLWVIDDTKTAMGGRLLREWVEAPLLSARAINGRLDAVEELVQQDLVLDSLRQLLPRLHDISRLISRICYGSAGPRDLAALRSTLSLLPELHRIISGLNSGLFIAMYNGFDLLDDIAALLTCSLSDDPPLSAKDEGIIREGYMPEVDELRAVAHNARDLLLKMEAEEREKTGIKTLKVGYNKVFGYYIEISKSRVNEAPEYYIRKQTLTNGERFITEELKELENRILSAGERLQSLEYRLFCEIRDQVASAGDRIQRAADFVAHIDVLQSLASVAGKYDYHKPVVDDGAVIDIKDGRHPVVEQIIGAENYVPNDCRLDPDLQRMMLITGPNMTGKSTYMRQVALIVLLARIGSFVPASSAVIGACDRIFTRVGAADDLASGQSTFMVEMNETSNILRHATSNSLIILDEIGRGTSTFDGLSIAWAVAEYIIQDKCGAKTLFATHYHELVALEESFPLIKNYSIAVKESSGGIVFLRKILPGGTDRSYGIQVAQLAGLPREVIHRAKEIMAQLEAEKHIKSKLERGEQLTFADFVYGEQVPQEQYPMVDELHDLNIDDMTPLEALMKIAQWKEQVDG